MNRGFGAPFFYDYLNVYDSVVHPSTLNITNTGLAYFFRRYLLQKILSVFKWTFPETWNEDYFKYVLYCWGYICILNTDKFGVIPQGCVLSGYGLYYQPTDCNISNPLLQGMKTLKIGTQCTLIKLQPDYGNVMDIVTFWGDLMALAVETGSISLLNSRLAYLFGADSKAEAETFKKLFDDISSGKPAVVYDRKGIKRDKDNLLFEQFEQNVGSNFITPEVLNVLSTLENMFDTFVGIPAANTEKRERMINAEIKVGSVETYSRTDMWLNSIQKSIKEANSLFGLTNFSVDWRYSPELTGMGGVDNASKSVINNGFIQ